MKTVYFATRLRGFFKQLINSSYVNIIFSYNQTRIYETNTYLTKLKNLLGRSRLFDMLGIIQIVKCKNTDCDIIGSFNRFLRTKRPYFIYVENPTALFHYRLERKKSVLGARRIQKELRSPYLKGIVFMSNACESTFENICGQIPPSCISTRIYPLIPENKLANEYEIRKKIKYPEFKLLYVVQGQRFISKGGLEILSSLKELRANGLNVSLHIVTSVKHLSNSVKSQIFQQDGVKVDDFNYTFQELQKVYFESHILLQPTSDESFGLTILEAMKSGLPVIASKLYAIPELVTDNWNGFLCNPHYWFFDKNNIPNPEVWNNRKSTIYSGIIDDSIVRFLFEKIHSLYYDRELLYTMSLNSLSRSSSPPFSESFIASQWNEFFAEM